jgi:hypothetical protein
LQRNNPTATGLLPLNASASALAGLRGIGVILLAALAVTSSHAAPSAVDHIRSVDVVRTALRVHLDSGRIIQGRDLEGATLSLAMAGKAGTQQVHIQAVVIDPLDPQGEVQLYRMTALNPATGIGEELCDPDPQGQRWAFPVQGQWDAHGRRTSQQGFTLTCASGAQGKCLRFGYQPWKTTADGVRLEDYHQACIRMVTADYCGGHATTKDGMAIDLYDKLGIQTPADSAGHDDLRFEAAWNITGAACVAHTRVPANISLQQLAAACPRLQARLGAANCTEQKARSGQLGTVLLFNRSR